MKFFDMALLRLNTLCVWIAGIAVITLMSLATINVCLRLFQMPYRGTYEIVSFLGAVVIAFALGETQRKKSHIVVDILSDRYPAWLRNLFDGIGYLVSFIFFIVIGWVLVRWGKQIAESGEVSETLKIVYYPLIYLVALGFVVLSFTLFVDFLQTLIKKEGKKTS